LTDVVRLPRADDRVVLEWHDVHTMIGFVGSIFSTAQNWRDTLQSQLPSYRERILQIRLEKDEGGLNLDMPGKTIRSILERGRQAGDKLDGEFHLPEHQWVRYQVLMAQLEKQLRNLRDANGVFKVDYQKLGIDQLSENFPFMRADPCWRAETERIMAELCKLLDCWRTAYWTDGPKPEPVLRVTPDL
jgi:hypothetical protein